MKYAAFLLVTIFFVLIALPASASLCGNRNGHKICILSINRSAKNYWEYRAEVSVDQVKQPMKVYNCRHHIQVEHDGVVMPFQQNDPGHFICSYFSK
ncbi:MAG: hypothetical protein PUP93_15435 [Rhizonema sp. NSF051]|nr:hypothetical protein [Rhizonema sp. NSF051]